MVEETAAQNKSTEVRRLNVSDAGAICACFERVYGMSYGEPLFYHADKLAEAIAAGKLCAVGAVTDAGEIQAHMAMLFPWPGGTPELGNTVVDPSARGSGLAWAVGNELIAWCTEKGHQGFLH